MSTSFNNIQVRSVEKNSSNHNLMISCLQRSQNFLDSCATFLKTTCLHVSFTAYENFYKLTKMYCLLKWFPLPLYQKCQKKKSNNQTYIHLYTGSLTHNYIYGRSLSGDPLSIIMPFCLTRASVNVNQLTSHLNLRPTVCLSVLT